MRTKINIFNSVVKSVLLYGSETWKLTKQQSKRLNSWQNRCLRKILRIFWPQTITNVELYNQTRQEPLNNYIKRRRWKWIGHILRMPQAKIPSVALTWAPEGKRKRGRPRMTWRRMVEEERTQAGWACWSQARTDAADRLGWRKKLRALCATWHEEDK